jgi:hypothetical protein
MNFSLGVIISLLPLVRHLEGKFPKGQNRKTDQLYSSFTQNRRLKGTVSWDFLLQVFSCIIFPQAPKNNIRIISNFFENSQRYSQVKVHHWYQRHRRQILQPVPLLLLIPESICHRCQRYRRQVCHRCQRQTGATLKRT